MGVLASQLAHNRYPGWEPFFEAEQAKPYFARLDEFVTARYAGAVVYPPPQQIFAAFATPPAAVRAVILGQDPYHEEGQAMGLAFSVQAGVKAPPSLRNILKELESDTGTPAGGQTDLTPWAKNGVFLLNAVLTVEQGAALAHTRHGWEEFVAAALSYLCAAADTPLAVVLWGAFAQRNKPLFVAGCQGRPLLVVESAHPSPLSAYRGFFGSRPFSQINHFLAQHGSPPLDWRLAN
ncbi:MAG: uracil-DNA glycosylase [Gemmiger sp.]|nr:uracil-DNA glycosylase [Gemmiger sp.]